MTAVAFVLWYGAVGRLGAAKAGLLTGVAPVAAAVAGVALDRPVPAAPVWVGVAVVAAGLVSGLRHRPDTVMVHTRHSRQVVRTGRLRPAAGRMPRRWHPAEDS